ncbi:MAG: single-stranded DNA-binding protein [Halomonas sp.]|nr:single-stranded DNA-binding protein [Halomonas sp.]
MSGVYAAVGRIGRDAEVRHTPNGNAVAGFPVAVDVGFGDRKETLWLDASLWGKRAEGGLTQHLMKGQQVFVQGEIGTREFQKRDGTPGFAVTLKVSEIDLVGGQPQGQPQQRQAPAQQPNYQQAQANYAQQQTAPQSAPPGGFDDFDDEIPF